jgi:hypothetical protein
MFGALLLALTMCHGQRPPEPISQATITNPMAYLVDDSANAGRHDWPLPVGYVALDNKRETETTARQYWDIVPFGSYEPKDGDGFQVVEIGKDGWIRFTSTRDGGTPWEQHFVGQRCGGSGWLVFGTDAQSGRWREVVAWLSIAQDPTACPSLGEAYTRYRLEMVEYPFAIKSVLSTRTISTVITEHYDRRTIDASSALERSYLGEGYGLLRWEAWTRQPPVMQDLPERCTTVAFSVPPAPGWQLNDCRTYTNIPR